MGNRVRADGVGQGTRFFSIMINSTSNKQVKNLIQLQTKAKARKEQRLFVAEGVRMFREVPRELLVKTYVSASFLQKEQNRAMLAGGDWEVLSDEVFARAADTKTPQGVLCVVRQREYSFAELAAGDAPRRYAGPGESGHDLPHSGGGGRLRYCDVRLHRYL